jgi:translation initiation factor 3 subunit A
MMHRDQAQYSPANALRRAREFESSGDKDKALDHLYELLAARRMPRQWVPAHEEMFCKFIELAVEYREARKCKEGLHAYRGVAQAQAPASLEKVVLYLVDTSMRKAAEARARTDSAAQLDKVEDLEEEESPETLLMGAVTSEGSRDRAEREILVPWVRHMWDTYRNVLDTLKNTPLENLYHLVARRAMAFCKEYNRGAEFRKLTMLLRTHLMTIRKNADAAGKALTTEAVEKHVATRFVQLEHCADMAMWNEGFRSVEDIHEIMEGAGFTPKPQLMATYYEKLARIFWVSENYLFHAYA